MVQRQEENEMARMLAAVLFQLILPAPGQVQTGQMRWMNIKREGFRRVMYPRKELFIP